MSNHQTRARAGVEKNYFRSSPAVQKTKSLVIDTSIVGIYTYDMLVKYRNILIK